MLRVLRVTAALAAESLMAFAIARHAAWTAFSINRGMRVFLAVRFDFLHVKIAIRSAFVVGPIFAHLFGAFPRAGIAVMRRLARGSFAGVIAVAIARHLPIIGPLLAATDWAFGRLTVFAGFI